MEEKKRKKWTPITAPDELLLKTREKRKWQIALRRYIIEKHKCTHYAPYFGVDIETFRAWIEIQFKNKLNWDDFSTNWQLDHVLPVVYFDFSSEEELRLCWNFINIRVSKNASQESQRFDLESARQYFEELYRLSQYPLCKKMIAKIDGLRAVKPDLHDLGGFISERAKFLALTAGFGCYQLQQLNEGIDITEVMAEQLLLKKFG